MAGTVVADTLQAASTSTLVLKNGVANTPPTIQDSAGTQIGTFCRAFVNFNGTGTVAIRGSFNVTSITDNGTGDYTVNIDVDMPDVNYCPQVTVWNTSDGGTSDLYTGVRAVVGQVKGASGIAVGAVGVQTTATSTDAAAGARVDFSGVFVAVFR